jgi:hypothetical protein
MTNIESIVSIESPINVVFDFLADLNNHQQLMPENIYNWSSTKDEARFTIQNMAKLAIKVSSIIQNKEIIIERLEEFAKTCIDDIIDIKSNIVKKIYFSILSLNDTTKICFLQ